MEKMQLEEVHESAIHSTEVEYQLASTNEISRPTVMQDVQTMEVAWKRCIHLQWN